MFRPRIHCVRHCTAKSPVLAMQVGMDHRVRLSINSRRHRDGHWLCWIYVYVKHDDVRFFLARCSPAAECFFSRFRPRGKLACYGYIIKHACISAELRGGARRIKLRLAGSIWQGIASRPPETSRSLGTPHVVFQNLIFRYSKLLQFFVLCCFVRRKMAH